MRKQSGKVVYEFGYLWLGELTVRADSFSLGYHLFVYEGGEQQYRYLFKGIIVLDKLCEPVTVHLRHFDIADNAGDMRSNVCAVLELGYVIPGVLAVSEGYYIMETYVIEGLGYHLIEEFGIVRNDNSLVAHCFVGTESVFYAFQIQTYVLVESGNDLFKVEDNDYPVVYLCNACGKTYSIASRAVCNSGGIGDLRPRYSLYSFYFCNVESNVHAVEFADNEYFLSGVFMGNMNDLMQINNGDQFITWDKHALHFFRGVRNRRNVLIYHDLNNFGDIYAKVIVAHLKFKQFKFVGSAFKQNICIHEKKPPPIWDAAKEIAVLMQT